MSSFHSFSLSSSYPFLLRLSCLIFSFSLSLSFTPWSHRKLIITIIRICCLFIPWHCDAESPQSVMRISPKTVWLLFNMRSNRILYHCSVCSITTGACERGARREWEQGKRQSKRIESKILLSMWNKRHETKISGFYSLFDGIVGAMWCTFFFIVAIIILSCRVFRLCFLCLLLLLMYPLFNKLAPTTWCKCTRVTPNQHTKATANTNTRCYYLMFCSSTA